MLESARKVTLFGLEFLLVGIVLCGSDSFSNLQSFQRSNSGIVTSERLIDVETTFKRCYGSTGSELKFICAIYSIFHKVYFGQLI